MPDGPRPLVAALRAAHTTTASASTHPHRGDTQATQASPRPGIPCHEDRFDGVSDHACAASLPPGVRRSCATRLSPEQPVLPLFVRPGKKRAAGDRLDARPLPALARLLAEEVRQAAELGLGGVLLFGIPDAKDATGSDATSDSGIIAQAVRAAKEAAPDVLVITDVCFCEYTDHGHCGPLDESTGRLDVDNDATLELLGRQAVVHARAGADMVAPSGMMDGMVGAIRAALDAAGLRARADHELRGQVRQRLLRPVPRRGRERPAVRRPPQLPDGPGRRRRARRCARWSSTWPKGPTW